MKITYLRMQSTMHQFEIVVSNPLTMTSYGRSVYSNSSVQVDPGILSGQALFSWNQTTGGNEVGRVI